MTPDELERALEKHLPSPVPEPAWVRELESLAGTTPNLYEALMLRQRMLETLLDREQEAPASQPPIHVPSSLVRCPYCHTGVDLERETWVACAACLARHHAACWGEGGACGTCGERRPLASRPAAPRRLPRLVLVGAAGLAAVLGGVTVLALDGRGDQLERLEAKAKDLRSVLEHEQGQRAVEREAWKNDRESLELRLHAEAEEESRLAAARLSAAERAAEKREAQRAATAAANEAESLLESAESDAQPLAAAKLLARAAALAPPEAGALRRQIEERRFVVELELARRALTSNDTRAAAFWLADMEPAPAPWAAEIRSIHGQLERIANGERDLEEGRVLRAQGRLAEARVALERARSRGRPVEPELADVTSACRARAEAILMASQGLERDGHTADALAKASEALEYDPGSNALQDFLHRGSLELLHEAEREAVVDPGSALLVLERASRQSRDGGVQETIARELRARRSLSPRDDLVYVPARDAGARDFCIQRRLVTNEEYAEFVRDGGYDPEREDLWGEDARKKLPTFVDTDGRAGPRGWAAKGEYRGGRDQPVRGVTIEEARAYARWLSHRRGEGYYRLPTSAEWEIAAGYDAVADHVRHYPWGDAFDAKALSIAAKEPPVTGKGMKGSSPAGLVDLAGSVRQWVEHKGSSGGTKGSDFAATELEAQDLARVKHTESPGLDDLPADERKSLLLRTGFRLVRDVDR